MITKHFDTPSGQAKLCFVRQYVTVVFPHALAGCEDDAVSVPWDKLDDVEWLAEAFGDCTVKVFKPIVEQLGLVHTNKAVYEVLL